MLADGDILLANCFCTTEGYTGAPEPTNVSVIVNGARPWAIKKLGALPGRARLPRSVWFQGPNFGTASLYEPSNNMLYFKGGF